MDCPAWVLACVWCQRNVHWSLLILWIQCSACTVSMYIECVSVCPVQCEASTILKCSVISNYPVLFINEGPCLILCTSSFWCGISWGNPGECPLLPLLLAYDRNAFSLYTDWVLICTSCTHTQPVPIKDIHFIPFLTFPLFWKQCSLSTTSFIISKTIMCTMLLKKRNEHKSKAVKKKTRTKLVLT